MKKHEKCEIILKQSQNGSNSGIDSAVSIKKEKTILIQKKKNNLNQKRK